MINPDRDQQFRHIAEQTQDFQDRGQSVISVDTKKKEKIGNFKNAGREYRPKGTPVDVQSHDFPDVTLGKATSYGVYDPVSNTGWVNVESTMIRPISRAPAFDSGGCAWGRPHSPGHRDPNHRQWWGQQWVSIEWL